MPSDVVEAFVGECEALSSVLHDLPDDIFGRITNCPPWDLKDLVVATGRRQLSAAEVAILGALAERFPLLSLGDLRAAFRSLRAKSLGRSRMSDGGLGHASPQS